MKSLFLAAISVLMLCAALAPVQAQQGDWRGGIRGRISESRASIDRGVEQGVLTRRDAQRFYDELDDILSKIERMKADGYLSDRERDIINRDLDRLIRDIGRERHEERRQHSQELLSNWNSLACETTDTATFRLERQVRADRFEVWFRFRGRESSVGYTLAQDGQTLRSGVLVRGDCAPGQDEWCIAAEGVDMRLRPGTYVIRTDRPRICQNAGSGGNGFAKLYGAAQW